MKKIIFIMLILLMLPIVFSIPDSASININLLSQDPDPVLPGSTVDVRFQVENLGREDVNGAIFEIITESPLSLKPSDNGIRTPGTLFGGQIGEDAYVLFYELKVSEDALEEDSEVRIRYSLDNGANWRRLEPFSIHIKTRDPILSINSVVSEPKIVGLGKEVKLSLIVENLAESYVKNVRVNLNLYQNGIELPFSPIGSSNERVLKLLNPGDKKMVSFNLICDADAVIKSYKLPISLTYEDDSGEIKTQEGVVSLTIGESADLIFTLDNNDAFVEGETSNLDVRFINKGLSDVKLLTVKLKEGDGFELIGPEVVYVGNIDSDDYETAEFKIKTKTAGNIEFPLTIEYLDSSNKKFSEEIILSHKSYSLDEAKAEGLIKSSNYIGIIIFLGIVIIGFIIYRQIKKK